MSIFYFISQSLSFYVIICNRNSIEVSRWEAVCRSEGQAFNFFFLWNPYRMCVAFNLRPCMIRPLVISRMYSLQGLQSRLFASVVRSKGFLLMRAACPAHAHLSFFNDLSEIFWMIRINRAIRA